MLSDGAVRMWYGSYSGRLNRAPVLLPEHICISAVFTVSQMELATPLAAGPMIAL